MFREKTQQVEACLALFGQDVVRMLMTRAFQEEAVTWQRLLRRLGPELDEAIDIEDGLAVTTWDGKVISSYIIII